VDYLKRSAADYFQGVGEAEVYWTNAGGRALVRTGGRDSSISRRHKIRSEPGLVSVLGGKITGYRAIARDATDAVCRQLRVSRKCRSAEEPLPGARGTISGDGHLQTLYGSRANDVLRLVAADPQLGERLAPEYPDIAAQVVFAVREEQCARAEDFIMRRTLLGFSRDQGRRALPAVQRWLAHSSAG
jgi:glycerol-3-phosphate dehydrogenase